MSDHVHCNTIVNCCCAPVLMLPTARSDHIGSDAPLHLLCSGAFKFRGACNAVQALSEEEAQKVVH